MFNAHKYSEANSVQYTFQLYVYMYKVGETFLDDIIVLATL